MTNYKQIYAINAENQRRIKRLVPDIHEESGIYIFTRTDESGIKYAYVGQAKNLLQRTAAHLNGYQHIDLSIKKHGLYDAEKQPFGWQLWHFKIPECGLDEAEQTYIKLCAENGFQLRNKTSGGQGEGKRGIADDCRKGYLQGKREGYEKAYKEIGEIVRKYTAGILSKGGAVADRKTAELLQKFSVEENKE